MTYIFGMLDVRAHISSFRSHGLHIRVFDGEESLCISLCEDLVSSLVSKAGFS